MQSSRRFLLHFPAALIAICFVASPRAVVAQNSVPLPPPWNDAVTQLADKIASKISPLHPLSIETKNISDLSPAETAKVTAALETALKARSFRIAGLDAPGATPSTTGDVQPPPSQIMEIPFTVSQSVEGHVLIAELRSGVEPEVEKQILIVAAPPSLPGTGDQTTSTLTLDKRLIWQQPEKFLDFLPLSPGANGNPSLLAILEPERLVYHRAQDGKWALLQAIPLVQPARRDLDGYFDVDQKHVILGRLVCTGELAQPETVKCSDDPARQDVSNASRKTVAIPGAGEVLPLDMACGHHAVALATAAGDYTSTDSIQGYESDDGRFNPSGASGAPIQTEGPIISMTQEPTPSSARVVVYNLGTKNYEGYIVTAVCNH
jgi:hypothetical protein